jgi:amidase
MIWQIGPMARRVEDLWTLMAMLSHPDGEDITVIEMPLRDPARLDVSKLRVAFFTDNGVMTPDAATVACVRTAAQSLSAAGLSVEEATPAAAQRSYYLEMKLIGPDGGDGLRAYLRSIGSDHHHRLLEGWLSKLEAYRTDLAGFAGYWAELQAFRLEMSRFMQPYDVLLSPVAAFPALPHGTSINDDVFPGFSYTMLNNLTGWPGAVVRCGTSPEGLPIGVQVTAKPWREDLALSVAQLLEERCGGWLIPQGAAMAAPS